MRSDKLKPLHNCATDMNKIRNIYGNTDVSVQGDYYLINKTKSKA